MARFNALKPKKVRPTGEHNAPSAPSVVRRVRRALCVRSDAVRFVAQPAHLVMSVDDGASTSNDQDIDLLNSFPSVRATSARRELTTSASPLDGLLVRTTFVWRVAV